MFKKATYLFVIMLLTMFLYTSTSLAINVELGARGPEVEEVQQLLYDLGYDITVDGIYGYQTREVVEDFQLNHGLNVDGIVGEKTYNKLKETRKDIRYQVQKGDTLYEIALAFDTTVADIKERNNLKSDIIRIGQELFIPKTGIGGGNNDKLYKTIYHLVQPGDTLSSLAKRYGTDIKTIKLANNLRDDTIVVGKRLAIPHVHRENKGPFRLAKGAFIWPVFGRISSGYGYRTHPIKGTREFHGGIDIAVPLGTEIRAAAGGTVVKSGWIRGYGKTIIIDHGNNVRTLYAHNSRLLARSGSKVRIGQVIALAGSTGLSTGSHLDFRIFFHDKTVNPMKYLP